jgi:hypothetical protein
MGTPERQIDPLSVVLGLKTFWYDELDDEAWIRIIENALASLDPLKNVSGFMPFANYIDKGMTPEPNLIFAGGLNGNSLCREMLPIFDVDLRGENREEYGLFLLKDGGFAILTTTYIRARGACAYAIVFEPKSLKDLRVPAAKAHSQPSVFWAQLLESIHKFSMENRDRKSIGADQAATAFGEIDAMRSRIIFPADHPGC